MRWTQVIQAPTAEHMHLVGDHYNWTTGFEDGFKLTLTVTAETTADVHLNVGLIQTLTHSTRVSTYGEAGKDGGVVTYTMSTHKLPPCLDGSPAVRPYYDGRCTARSLPGVHQSVTLTLEDDPLTRPPERLKGHIGGKVVKKNIATLHVKDEFLISLVVFDPKHKPGDEDSAAFNHLVKAQWKWGYEYNLKPRDPSNPAFPARISSLVTPITSITAGSVHLVADGDPAETLPTPVASSPTGWVADLD